MKSLESVLRSLFISVFPFTGLLVLTYGIVEFFKQDFSLGTLGMVFISATIVTFFAGLFLKPRARTDKNLFPYSVGIVLGVFISLFYSFISGVHIYTIVPSLVLALGWIVYLKWYSVFKDRTNDILQIGNQLPEFQLENYDKKSVSASSFHGDPSIFLFYRGNWCPLCMAQIKEIAAQYEELEKLGVNTVLISPQPHTQTKKLVNKFKLNFNFLVDRKNKVAKQLGILAENGIPAGFQVLGYDSDTVMPTVVITNKEGEIIFADLTDNYRVRPEPETFLKVIKELISI
ncbi:peroxiredoxin family protein [Maribacter sp. 2308TA10-17]|uniref:peroxiredoxin family protein n=1 Tax=Maribacter sp. 2308TA10-17 TaxID=3386276 RepID=UPI0039BD3101